MTTEDCIEGLLHYAPMTATEFAAGEEVAASEVLTSNYLAMIIAYLRASGILPDRDTFLAAVEAIVVMWLKSQPAIGPIAARMITRTAVVAAGYIYDLLASQRSE